MPYEKIQLLRFSHYFNSINGLFYIKTIKELDLGDNGIGADEIIHFVDLLRENTVSNGCSIKNGHTLHVIFYLTR